MTLTLEDITKLLTEQNELFAKQWQNQMQTLTKALEKYHQRVSLPCINNILLPKFSGDASEDVREFLRHLDQEATFYKLTDYQKAEVLPLLLTRNVNVWFSASSHFTGKTYNQLCEENTFIRSRIFGF